MKEKTNSIALIGSPCVGRSKMLEQILSEKGLTMDDVVVMSLEDVRDMKKAFEIIDSVPDGKILFIEDINLLLEPPIQKQSFEDIDITTINKHPFDKYISKRGKKW